MDIHSKEDYPAAKAQNSPLASESYAFPFTFCAYLDCYLAGY